MRKACPSVLLIFVFITLLAYSGPCAGQPLMVEKNLFAPDRKPPSPDAGPAAPAKKTDGLPPKSVQLDGVFIEGNHKSALVRVKSQLLGDPKNKDPKNKDLKNKDPFPYMTVSEGGSIGDYRVATIEPRKISLVKDGQEYVINLFADGKVVPPAAPLPAAQVAPVGGPNPAPGASPAAGAPPLPGAPAVKGQPLARTPGQQVLPGPGVHQAGAKMAPQGVLPPAENPDQNIGMLGDPNAQHYGDNENLDDEIGN